MPRYSSQHQAPPTPKQTLITHLEGEHGNCPSHRQTHRNLAVFHHGQHHAVLTHTHDGDGFTSGVVARLVPITLIRPRNPSGSKPEDRNWTLQVNGHDNPHIVQYVRLYSTRPGEDKGAIAAAEEWLGYSPEWYPTGGGGYEVLGGRARQ